MFRPHRIRHCAYITAEVSNRLCSFLGPQARELANQFFASRAQNIVPVGSAVDRCEVAERFFARSRRASRCSTCRMTGAASASSKRCNSRSVSDGVDARRNGSMTGSLSAFSRVISLVDSDHSGIARADSVPPLSYVMTFYQFSLRWALRRCRGTITSKNSPYRLRPDHHRAGVRIRLFRHAGLQSAARRRLRVVLVNSNPATIMTDPEFADRTYIEPITPEVVEKILGTRETGRDSADDGRPDRAQHRHGTESQRRAREVRRGNDRRQRAGDREGRRSADFQGIDDAHRPGCSALRHRAYARRSRAGRGRDRPLPAHHSPGVHPRRHGRRHRLQSRGVGEIAKRGLELSPVTEVLIEESLLGWKEFEMEVMRDRADNCVIICSIENFDPMGVHTGDSITVAPIQTLTDKEYQIMRDASFAVIREIGVETGGSNIQFAVNPGQRPNGHHRDESARLALVRAGLEGDRFPDRENRRQTRGRLHARRNQKRHHARNAGQLRADD